MEIERIGASHSDSFSLVERARQLAQEYQAARVQDQNVRTGVAAPNVTTSTVFTPAVYAQAAQYQLYTQTGAIAAMNPNAANVAPVKSDTGPPDAIRAVDRASGSRIDTKV